MVNTLNCYATFSHSWKQQKAKAETFGSRNLWKQKPLEAEIFGSRNLWKQKPLEAETFGSRNLKFQRIDLFESTKFEQVKGSNLSVFCLEETLVTLAYLLLLFLLLLLLIVYISLAFHLEVFQSELFRFSIVQICENLVFPWSI